MPMPPRAPITIDRDIQSIYWLLAMPASLQSNAFMLLKDGPLTCDEIAAVGVRDAKVEP